MTRLGPLILAPLVLALSPVGTLAENDAVTQLVEATLAMHRAAREAQARIDALAPGEGTSSDPALSDALRDAERELAALEARATAQAYELATLNQRLSAGEDLELELLPLVERMAAALDALVEADLPFRLAERRAAVADVHAALRAGRGGLAAGLRRVLEAYQRELALGEHVERYEARVETPGGPRLVDMLRVGRLALCYTTPDAREGGCWDRSARDWHSLDAAGVSRVREALDAAASDVPAFVVLPSHAGGAW